ncbi:NAD-dependent succinate-semialdehyde dehydrogenase [Actinomadura sp. K4S16]|uniref:NAD-dependent succinate-semialdehyde dehydrogenase n=1 Tax=Actinomadura sp. K4S16 TaxID=1316147 RepID=UPI0011EECE49|nr:NAD-dependent succinate-semialdehyde dehydrogenase [Actinomadura sp. K4S16]
MTDQGTLLINGNWRSLERTLDVIDPADGSVIGAVAWGSAAEAVEAADAAAKAFPAWAGMPPRDRADILLAAAELVDRRREEIGSLLAREAGKRLPEAVAEVRFSAEYLRWFAEEIRRPQGEILTPEQSGRRQLTFHRPAGVVASLTPWNFPCSIQARKLAPALVSGCTVVARVSEKAPLAATELIRTLTDAGIPPGVVNLVHGPAPEVTDALLAHPAVRIVTFTGSTEVGKKIMALAARRIVRPLLELGGDAPFIVFEDADLDAAVEGAVLAKTRNTGQSCVAANRFLVQENVYEEFTARLAARLDAMHIGNGLDDPCPDLGPVIDGQRVAAVTSLVDEALAAGARRLTAERPVPSRGSYLAPQLLCDVPDHVALAREEVFGPAAAVSRFRDEAEALDRANASEVGLAAFVYTADAGRVWRLADHLQVGIVGANDPLPSVAFAPMGGVKQSGLGREGAAAGLTEFQDVRYLAWRP